MTSKILIASVVFLALVALGECGGLGGGGGGGGGGEHKHVIISVPIHHKNVHTKKIITKHISYSGTDDGEVVCHGSGCDGGDGFSHGKVSGSISIGEPHYSYSSGGHGWH